VVGTISRAEVFTGGRVTVEEVATVAALVDVDVDVDVDAAKVDVVAIVVDDGALWPDGDIRIACGSRLPPPNTPKFITDATTAPPTMAGATNEITRRAFGDENLLTLIGLASNSNSSLIVRYHPYDN
jgi:hypothetical protein